MATKDTTTLKVETIEDFTARLGKVKGQRELAKMLAAEQAEGKRKPFLAAIEKRQSARARELKSARRSSAAPHKSGGKAAAQNSAPIALGTFGKDDARPLAELYMDKAGEMELSVAFGDERSLVRNLEPVAGVTVLPKNGNLVTSSAVPVDTAGMPGQIGFTHAYLLADGKPFGRCELAAPITLSPGQRTEFKPGTLMFRS